jgi:UbiD family decarboxylase
MTPVRGGMTMEDLRDWIGEVDKRGDLKRMEGADWDLEIGCIVALSTRSRDCPALLFDNIKDYPPGYRLLTGTLNRAGKLALTLGLPYTHSNKELLDQIKEKLPVWERDAKACAPRVVNSGPVLENIDKGDDIDLYKFPSPRWNEKDGGRYIGTGCAMITRDPDTGEVNLGTYRVMIHDKKTTALQSSPSKHGFLDYKKYHARGEPAPVAVTIGQHPLILVVGGIEVPHEGISEYHFAGAVQGEPIEVIEEEVTGLPIPANAEIVIAGFSPPDREMMEGPFGEFLGYYGRRKSHPVIDIERVYYRNEPIILGAPPGRAPSDYSFFISIIRSAMLYNQLIGLGLPDIKEVWMDEVGQQQLLIISLKQRYPGHAKQAAVMASQSRLVPIGKYVIVVDEDIDPTNIQDVLWALCTRSDPEKDIDITRRSWSSPLDTTIPRSATTYLSSRAVIEACKPFEWMDEFPEEIRSSSELVERVKQKWGDLLNF